MSASPTCRRFRWPSPLGPGGRSTPTSRSPISRYNGEPLALCPRAALKRAVEAWASLGYEPHLGFEMEFYVMQPDPEAPGGFGPLNIPSHRVYGVGLGGDNTGLMFDLYDAAEQCELDIEGILGEFHPGQMELNMKYGPALDAADRAFICKEMTRELAARKGYWITYMGRPMAASRRQRAAHQPLADSRPRWGQRVRRSDGRATGCRHWPGSASAASSPTTRAMAAMSAPLVNSYKRLIPGIIAGYWANWGLDNRISTYRVPANAARRHASRTACRAAAPIRTSPPR